MSQSTNIALANDKHAESREMIDLEIAQLEERILKLKAARNTLIPFAKLHPEVVQEIFTLACQTYYTFSIGRTALKISWICRSWRNLALETSALWTSIDFTNITWFETALSRTRNRPLDFSFIPHRRDVEPLMSMCLPNLPRTSSLSLHPNFDITIDTSLNRLWALPAPNLVELRLLRTTLPPDVFAGSFPALHTLSLTSCTFAWESLNFHPGLKHLAITVPRSKTSLEDLVTKLQIVGPELESLDLMDTLLPPTTAIPAIRNALGPPQLLAKIESFQISEPEAPAVTFILNHLSFPSRPIKLIGLKVQGRLDQLDTVRAFVVSRPQLGKWLGDFVEIDLSETIVTIAVKELLRPFLTDFELYWVFRYTNGVSITIDIDNGDSLILEVLDILPLGPIKTLKLSGDHDGEGVTNLADRLGSQDTIETIAVLATAISFFTSSISSQIMRLHLSNQGNDNLDQDAKDTLLPMMRFHHLSTLIYYDESYLDDEDDPPVYTDHEELALLRIWLRWRLRLGLKLKKLVIKSVRLPDEVDVRLLYEGFVDEFQYIPHVDADDDE